ncbi:hypothetical protein K431DRAFT_221842 [Polychaeton citri CBS 116435]|uniref:Zn(2)-C6 fungal-type domain-containing protein n=1 Tax=Polychaeton citri CBS 116435 TaxID=1314669 RepID=A0A9P4Q8M3_9PEZI|nr:hypothetical protein K431DRAFT_221842 [Polychaeton citri CBS 116435]
MPLDTPILKVSRPVAACTRCRNAKIKCDGKLPACSSCEKNGRAEECKNTNEEFAKGKERSYVATLETRIEKLEARLEEARRRKPSVVEAVSSDDSKNVSRRPSLHAHDASNLAVTKAQRQRETSAIDDLVSDFGFLSVNATTRDFYGFTQAMSYARLIMWSCAKETLPEDAVQSLPSRHHANQLIQHYLDNVLAILPAFEEASFYGSVDSVFSTNRNTGTPFDHFTVRMVLAIASAMGSQQRGDQLYLDAIGHASEAVKHAEQVLHPGSITSIQALLLLVQYAMLDPHRFDSWNLIGAASRASVDLGLHQDPMKGAQMSRAKLDMRRKVFYCVYALDRSTSIIQSRAFSFSDDSVKVKIPYSKQQSTPSTPQPHEAAGMPPSWLPTRERALDFITIRKIQSKWYSDLFQSGRSRWDDPYSYIWDACHKMRAWFESISPPAPQHTKTFFELDLLYSYVYLLSPSPRVPVTAPFAQTLVFEHCIRYSSLVVTVIREGIKYSAPLTFYDAMRVYMTGRQFVDVLNTNLDMLLNGRLAAPPASKSGSPSAPIPPPVTIPAGEDVLKFNIERSIKCIQEFAQCLEIFGIRWGYLSWKQRFENETAQITDELKRRRQYVNGMTNIARHTSPYAHTSQSNSSGSTIPINNNYSMYGNAPTLLSQSQYQNMPQNTVSLSHYSPQPPTALPQNQGYPSNDGTNFQAPAVQPYHQQSNLQYPAYTNGQPPFSNQGYSARPSVQFANWAGYTAGQNQSSLLADDSNLPPDVNWMPTG